METPRARKKLIWGLEGAFGVYIEKKKGDEPESSIISLKAAGTGDTTGRKERTLLENRIERDYARKCRRALRRAARGVA